MCSEEENIQSSESADRHKGMIVVGDRGARRYLKDYLHVHVSCKHCPDIKAQSTVLVFCSVMLMLGPNNTMPSTIHQQHHHTPFKCDGVC